MRAPRFPLCLSARYRPLGKSEWVQGKTRNISASGVLLQAAEPLQVDTQVEVQFVLESDKITGPVGEVACRGRVVRVIAPSERQLSEFAVAIEQYNFLHIAPRAPRSERRRET
jgi:hypothetical protein